MNLLNATIAHTFSEQQNMWLAASSTIINDPKSECYCQPSSFCFLVFGLLMCVLVFFFISFLFLCVIAFAYTFKAFTQFNWNVNWNRFLCYLINNISWWCWCCLTPSNLQLFIMFCWYFILSLSPSALLARSGVSRCSIHNRSHSFSAQSSAHPTDNMKTRNRNVN